VARRNSSTTDNRRNGPSNEEYLALYEWAGQLRAAEPWKTLGSGDVIGVRDPETGVIGYCGVMGQLGEYLALHVYLGGAGIEAYTTIVEAGAPDDDPACEPSQMNIMLAGRSQINLVVEFCDVAEVGPRDKARAKALGLSYLGNNVWPVFLRNDPCLEPRDLDAWEVRFLTVAIQQILLVADRVRNSELEIPEMFMTDQVFVRVPENSDGVLVWKDAVEALETAPVPESDPLSESDLLSLERLPVRKFYLELAHTIMPAVVKVHASDRGMYTRMFIAVDGRTGKVLGFHTFDLREFPGAVLKQVAALLTTLGFIPSQLVVNDLWLFAAIGNAVPVLRNSLGLSNRMDASEDAVAALAGFMQGQHR